MGVTAGRSATFSVGSGTDAGLTGRGVTSKSDRMIVVGIPNVLEMFSFAAVDAEREGREVGASPAVGASATDNLDA